MKKMLALILFLLMVVSTMVISVSATPINFAPFWTDPRLSGDDYDYQMSAGTLAVHFATKGTVQQIKGFSIFTKSPEGGSFDLKLYKWEYNYAFSVAQEPIATLTGLKPSASEDWYDITLPAPVDLGEYVVLICNFDGKVMTVDRLTDNTYTEVYLNGEKKEESLLWAVEFTEAGGWTKAISEEVDSPYPIDPPAGEGGNEGGNENGGSGSQANPGTSDAAVVSLAVAAVALTAVSVVVDRKRKH